MSKYEVEIIETLSRVVEVEAANVLEAENIAKTMWENSEIILDADDFGDVEFFAERVVE